MLNNITRAGSAAEDTMNVISMKVISRRSALIAASVVLAAIASVPVAHAEELRPIEGKSLQLGDKNGVAFYTVQDRGYHVVAILAGPDGKPLRFESTLLPGQKVVVSVPGSVNTTAQKVEFLRRGNSLLVERPSPVTD